MLVAMLLALRSRCAGSRESKLPTKGRNSQDELKPASPEGLTGAELVKVEKQPEKEASNLQSIYVNVHLYNNSDFHPCVLSYANSPVGAHSIRFWQLGCLQ